MCFAYRYNNHNRDAYCHPKAAHRIHGYGVQLFVIKDFVNDSVSVSGAE